MKAFMRYLLLALVVIGFTVPAFSKAEAAKVAVLPLATVEEDAAARRVWIEETMKFFQFPEFDMVDDTALEAALAEENYAVVGKQGPNEAMLKRIMAKTGADMAVMMTVDELTLEPLTNGPTREDYVRLTQKTRTMLVNGITGKVNAHRVNDYDDVEYAVVVRSPYMHDQFRNTVIRELKRVSKAK